MPSIALVTAEPYEVERAAADDWYVGNILEEDRLLSEALAGHCVGTERVAWSRPDIDWSRFDAVVLRTTWDYFERIDEFRDWLERVDRQTRLLNPLALVRWNLDKRYLLDLDRAGVATVPTRVFERGANAPLAEVARETGWTELVLKPVVSACAFETFRVDDPSDFEPRWQQLLSERDMLVQSFQPAIVDEGEITVMVIGGEVTHAVRKSAKSGDFRVQDDHGGTVHEHVAQPDEVVLARAATAACAPTPLYGRVDMVRGPDGPRVMELELIEPELWLRLHPPAAERMATALVAALG